ncbi:D-alanine--D-alanine ligase family protein [Nocardioides zhouii]|uniref:D-alanine--D-alanine ligase n=1 Tax=Nocardioides zhouii TaxID=1168729 RepID=A0A4Q2SKU7_9ACTN|nr:D-alanine--D-alanine ligase family protein [Nocardioides zhouii]RYC05783.1 D-alanine--D-alanine ligase [Nocardioides zhouii]
MTVRVAVIGGGQNCEHEVSLASAAGMVRALLVKGYEVVSLTIATDGTWRDGAGRGIELADAIRVLGTCDVAVPAVHGPRGEDGTLAALCELALVPYVGSGVRAGAVAMDKWTTKLVAQAVGIVTAPGVLLTATTARSYVWTRPVVVKPVAAGSSHGVSLVSGPDDLEPALSSALALDDRMLVEEVVTGREIDVAVLGRPGGERMVAPLLEITVEGVFDFDAKYVAGTTFDVPAHLTDGETAALSGSAIAMYDALGCAGVARIDFFLTADGPVLNEVNTMPGFTEQSQVPRMFAAAGMSYGDLLDILVRDVLDG